jgi:hypothetical protein
LFFVPDRNGSWQLAMSPFGGPADAAPNPGV